MWNIRESYIPFPVHKTSQCVSAPAMFIMLQVSGLSSSEILTKACVWNVQIELRLLHRNELYVV